MLGKDGVGPDLSVRLRFMLSLLHVRSQMIQDSLVSGLTLLYVQYMGIILNMVKKLLLKAMLSTEVVWTNLFLFPK